MYMETKKISSDFKCEKNKVNKEIKEVKYLCKGRKTLDKALQSLEETTNSFSVHP